MGDGAEHQGDIIRHAYAEPGIYTVKLTVTDNTDTLNNTTSTTFPVRVNSPPQPDAGDDQLVNRSEVVFNAENSSDQDDPITSYVWDFGDGSQKQGKAVSHVYALPGTYTVTLTVTDASGTRTASQSDTMKVTVNHLPIADAGGSQIASVGETVVLDGSFSEDPDGRIVSYQWDVAEGVTLQGERVEHQYQQPGQYQARLIVTDNAAAESTDYAVITVNARPVADFYPVPRVAPGQTVSFDGSPSADWDGEIRQAVWDFGDGTPLQEGLTAQHQFTAPGRYAVTLTVQDDSAAANNTVSHTQTVEVNYPPQADAGTDIHTCSQKVVFDASKSTDPDGDALVYLWDFGDGTRGQGRSIEHAYLNPGIYPVSLMVNDGYELSNSVSYATLTAYVNAPPVADLRINSDTVCAGELVLFDAGQSQDLEQGLLRYQWDLGDGKFVEGINPVREYTQGGDYRIRLQVTDDSELACNISEAEAILHVIDAPIADAGEDQTVCANTAVQFDGSASTGGGRRIKSYEWDFGDGQIGVGANPAHVYAQAGEYTARLLITVAGDGECANISEDEVTIRVMAAPVATFQVQKNACTAELLEFDATASSSSEGQISTFDWDFGDGTSASGEKLTHAYQTPGTYQATLRIATNSQGACRTSEYLETIIINAAPTPTIHVASAGQEPFRGERYDTEPHTVLHFSGAESVDSDGYVATYTWDFGDGQVGEGAFATHQYIAPGMYPVTLQIQDDSDTACDISTATMVIQVREPDAQPINGAEMVCVGQPFVYTVSPESQPVEWQLNDGITAAGNRFEHIYDTPGTYQLQAKVGIDWLPVKEITALQLPFMYLPDRLDVYTGDPVDIQPVYDMSTALPLQFQWDMGDGTLFTTERVSHQYTIPGEMTLQLLVTMQDGPECLQSTYSIPVVVHAPPEVTIHVRPDQIFTGGAHDAVTFNAMPREGLSTWNYIWDFGDGEQALGQRVSHMYRQSGQFQVTVTLSDPLLRTAQSYVFSTEIEVNSRKE
jgi:PKD repeat protein